MLDFNSATRFFLDRPEVQKALDAGTRRVLSRFGAYTRQRARSSIRTRKAASKPGSPPSNHEGSLKRLLFFVYEPQSKGVVIGPTLFRPSRAGGKTVPELEEEGGSVPADGRQITVKNKPGREAGTGRFLSAGTRVITLTGNLKYPARPYMKPAFDAELGGKLKALLTDFVSGGPT